MEQDINFEQFYNLVENNFDNLEIIDVRDVEESKIIKLKGSKLIPMEEIFKRADEIDWNKQVVFVCRTGVRSGELSEIFNRQQERDIKNLTGGLRECYSKKPDWDKLVIDNNKIFDYFKWL